MSEQDLNVEVQRLQCLQALGITVYHPRFRLPGAKPSAQGPWSAVGAEPRGEAHRPRPEAVPAQRAPLNAEPPPAAPAPMPRARDVLPEKAVSPAAMPRAAPTTVPVQNFQLLFLQVDTELALINQIPALARPQLQDKQLALLTNLLRWLGKSVPAQAPRMFRWPLPGLEHMAASMSAETSVLHFLEQASTERPFRFLLQLGPHAVAAPSAAWQAFATHSLDEMLALPTLKREAWQSLLPLHALLHANF